MSFAEAGAAAIAAGIDDMYRAFFDVITPAAPIWRETLAEVGRRISSW